MTACSHIFDALASKLRRFASAAFRLPSTIGHSLDPKTEAAARNIQAQLEHVLGNMRMLDYALPLVGAVIVFVHGDRAPFERMATTLIATLAACAINEFVLLRRWSRESDLVAQVKKNARLVSFAALVLMSAWGIFSLSLWTPPSSDVFALFVLSCTLAAATTMLAPHAATAAGSMAALSFSITVLELMNSYNARSPLVIIAIVYMALMGVQAYAIHVRFNRGWQLEQDREELIRNLRQAHESAVAASRAKSQFLANMSHELRTPLNAILGFSDIVRTNAFGNAPDRYSEYAGFIHQSGQHLMRLIGDVLDLAKIEAGRKELLKEPLDLAGLIDAEVATMAEKAAAKGVSVVGKCPRTLPLLRADRHAVRQILQHLLCNAVKFTPTDGKVLVSARLNMRNEIQLSVSDSGVGIAPEDQQHIFERFGRGKPEVTSVDRGSGLGLPIVKGLVEMHGGRIKLESDIGVGTSITVTFPASCTLGKETLLVA